jgi:hypothetical protein
MEESTSKSSTDGQAGVRMFTIVRTQQILCNDEPFVFVYFKENKKGIRD